MGDKDFTKYNLSCHRQGEQRHTNNTGEIHRTTTELIGKKEGRIIEAQELDLTGGMWLFTELLHVLGNSGEGKRSVCRNSVTAMGSESATDHPCTCIVRLRGRHTERARVGTDWPISGWRLSLTLRWSGRGA